MLSSMNLRDRVRGCLIAGAAGDALGYEVEFDKWDSIMKRFGPGGIQAYVPDCETGTAVISDDTQMTLFTANGLLLREARGKRPVEGWIYTAYLDWLATQCRTKLAEKVSWIRLIPELNVRRAPGGTCLNALSSGEMGSTDEMINNSKGCGGIMRVAPVAAYGVLKDWDAAKTARLGAEAAAITHSHPLGWMCAAAFVDIIWRVLKGTEIREAVEQCIDAMTELYNDDHWSQKLTGQMRRAVELTENAESDLENIQALGEGWVGDEALYIAVYCAVKYADDLDAALIAAVNHSGDSDSTGAVTGNIVGAAIGYEAIGEKWKKELELRELILEVADDLCADETSRSEAWKKKYA